MLNRFLSRSPFFLPPRPHGLSVRGYCYNDCWRLKEAASSQLLAVRSVLRWRRWTVGCNCEKLLVILLSHSLCWRWANFKTASAGQVGYLLGYMIVITVLMYASLFPCCGVYRLLCLLMLIVTLGHSSENRNVVFCWTTYYGVQPKYLLPLSQSSHGNVHFVPCGTLRRCHIMSNVCITSFFFY